MKLCPQCDFIYEDDQGFCDMDGKELVYEPTQTPVQGGAAKASLQLVPLSNLSQPSGSKTARGLFGGRATRGFAIAAGLLLAFMLVAAVWISSRLFSARTASSYNVENQNAKPGSSFSVSRVNNVPPTAAPLQSNPGSNNQRESMLTESTTPVLRPSASPIKALPGVKPLPRLEPIPRLKPLPKLQDQKRSAYPSQKSSSANGNVNTRKESGVTSFLKKTGRILKKPFKF